MPRQYHQLPQCAFSILVTLTLEPRHGYDIMKQVAADSNSKIHLGPGALYTSVKRLCEQGLIEEIEERTDTRRRYYRLTPNGRNALKAELDYYETAVRLAHDRQAQVGETELCYA